MLQATPSRSSSHERFSVVKMGTGVSLDAPGATAAPVGALRSPKTGWGTRNSIRLSTSETESRQHNLQPERNAALYCSVVKVPPQTVSLEMSTKKQSARYLHGFSREEQNRLYEQARVAEQRIFDTVDFSECEHILELGCGVGAQTEVLLRRFSDLHITALDASETQLAQARRRLAPYIDAGRVELLQVDAKNTRLKAHSIDGVFICWLLEHVPQPIDILIEAHRVLKPNGEIVCNEVLNATFYLEPYSPAVQEYWFKFNDYQWNLGGDPFVGAKLGALLIDAGFHRITSSVKSFHYDKRFPRQRKRFIKFWTSLLLSATPSMLESKKVSPSLIDRMVEELETAAKAEDSVIFYSWIQAHGFA